MAPAAVPTGKVNRLAGQLQVASGLPADDAFAQSMLDSLAVAGIAANDHFQALSAGRLAMSLQALADCAHFLTLLHGQVPSLIELACSSRHSETTGWLRTATNAFNEDRRWLVRLSVLTGGSLDRVGLSLAEQLVRDQRDAMLTLAASSRAGCALGAAIALVVEWQCVRDNLPRAAFALGAECRDLMAMAWPHDGILPVLLQSGSDMRMRRALAFGATQLVGLHSQLFDLLEARHAARLS